jgi:hypothetical protein
LKYSKRSLTGIGLLLIVITSSVVVLIYLNSNIERLEISFLPEYMNSAPGETGWFLVEINSTRQTTDIEIDIQTNVSIETDYTYWSQTPLLEIFLYPDSSHIDSCIEVNVTISSGALVAHDVASLSVLNWSFGELTEVIEKRDVFINYMAINYPELGINDSTSWTPIHNGAGILIVGHYLFKSDQWELEIDWHVMIAPHDWVKGYLRHRAEVQPSWAGIIESWSSDNHTIIEVEPPTDIYRPM